MNYKNIWELRFSILQLYGFIVFVIEFNSTNSEFQSPKDCGLTKKKVVNYIVGGEDVGTNEFPFMVSLQTKDNSRHFCGGSVLNKRWVLTAAHCIKIPLLMKRFIDPKEIKLIIGTNDVTKREELNTYEVEKWIINGCFMSSTKDLLSDDITLLKTKRDINFTHPNIGSICLPPKYSEPVGNNVMVMGWGVWSETNSFGSEKLPTIMQKIEAKLFGEEICTTSDYFRNIGFRNWPLGKRLCIRTEEGTICRGDSGGPAVQTINGKMYQIGIASFISGTLPLNTCDKSNPVYYLKVSKFIDWISNKMENRSDVKNEC